MKYAIQAHLVKGSSEVYWDKNLIGKTETKGIEEVTVFLTEREIADLHAAMIKHTSVESDNYTESKFDDYVHEVNHHTAKEAEYTYKLLRDASFDDDEIEEE